VKRYPSAAKADVHWARLAKKYKFESSVLLPAPKASKPMPAKGGSDDALLEAWWKKPDDLDRLRVLADSWAEQGDPRGEFVQLSLIAEPSPAQIAKRESLLKKLGGALVGPARPALREWELGPQGIVTRARCEADKLAEGIDAVSKLNPLLCLCVTSLKTRATAAALAKVSLSRIHFVSFTMGLIGSVGGSNVSDAALRAAAPAFRGVKNLALQARGYGNECFTPEGLLFLADHLEGIEYFALDYAHAAADQGKTALPPMREYVDVVTTHPAFRSLQAVLMEGADEAALRELPKVKTVIAYNVLDRFPRNAAALSALKTAVS